MVLPQAMAWVQYWFRVLSLKFCGKSKKICGDNSPQSPAFCMYALVLICLFRRFWHYIFLYINASFIFQYINGPFIFQYTNALLKPNHVTESCGFLVQKIHILNIPLQQNKKVTSEIQRKIIRFYISGHPPLAICFNYFMFYHIEIHNCNKLIGNQIS